MTFNWQDFFALAKHIESQEFFDSINLVEASQRSVVSRAYYSGYCWAFRIAKSLGYPANDSGLDHDGVRKFFGNRRTTETNKIASLLDQLHQDRIACDYWDNVYKGPADAAERSIKRTKELFVLLGDLQQKIDELKKGGNLS